MPEPITDSVAEAMMENLGLDISKMDEDDAESIEDPEEGGDTGKDEKVAEEAAGEPEEASPDEGEAEEEADEEEEEELAADGDADGEGEGLPEEVAAQLEEYKSRLEELEKAKGGLYADLRGEREKRQSVEGQLSNIMQALREQHEAQTKETEKVELPDKDEDPVGYVAALISQSRAETEERFSVIEQERQARAQREALEQAAVAVNAYEQEYSQKHEDYYDAIEWGREERRRIIAATRPDLTEDQVAQVISQGDQMLALRSVQQGKNPAQEAYEIVTRMGYSPNGSPSETKPKATEKKETKKPSPSLSSVAGKGGGRRGGKKITKEEFAKLPPGHPLIAEVSQDDDLLDALELEGYINV